MTSSSWRFVAVLAAWNLRFNPRTIHVEYIDVKLKNERDLTQSFTFPCQNPSTNAPYAYTHLYSLWVSILYPFQLMYLEVHFGDWCSKSEQMFFQKDKIRERKKFKIYSLCSSPSDFMKKNNCMAVFVLYQLRILLHSILPVRQHLQIR